jgi:uncharacterized protein
MRWIFDTDVSVPTRDGFQLATNVWRPADERAYPVLLARTPYDKNDPGLSANPKLPDVISLLAAGYAVVVQDIRGTGNSTGDFVPHQADGDDGVDTLAWLARQPWCDGRVGGWGGSFMGMAQWLTAAHDPVELRAIAPVMSSADLYRAPWYSPGGALSLSTFLGWSLRASGLAGQDKGMEALPVADRPLLNQRFPWFSEVLAHPSRDGYWQQRAAIDRCSSITVPGLHIGGWYDVFIHETVRGYAMMREHGGSAEARQGQRLVIGPWAHPDDADTGSFPDRSFGRAASAEAADLTGAHIRFFDEHVRGTAADQAKPVRIFVMGIDEWRDEDAWPLPDTRYTPYYLSGTDLSVIELDLKGQETYSYDPRHPVPTLGGTTLTSPGPSDQSSIEDRDDVLCFSTPILEQAVEVTGHIELILYVSSSAVDTDFTGTLVDVHPDGRAILLSEGILRARYRSGLEAPALLQPGEIYELIVDVGVTSNVFLPGHQIRLEVSSSNFPRYDRNSNTGENNAEVAEADLIVAVNSVHHGPEHRSRLVLPVISR